MPTLPENGQAGATDVTPEMLSAGARALSAFSFSDLLEGWISDTEVVSEVFLAMEAVRLSGERKLTDPDEG